MSKTGKIMEQLKALSLTDEARMLIRELDNAYGEKIESLKGEILEEVDKESCYDEDAVIPVYSVHQIVMQAGEDL